MKNEYTMKLSQKALQPIIDFANDRRGFLAAMKAEFDKKTGKAWRRENFERWLYPDPKQRTEPNFGAGLLLVQIGTKLMESWKEKERRANQGKQHHSNTMQEK